MNDLDGAKCSLTADNEVNAVYGATSQLGDDSRDDTDGHVLFTWSSVL